MTRNHDGRGAGGLGVRRRRLGAYADRGRLRPGLSTMVRDPELLGIEHEIADIAAVRDPFGGEPFAGMATLKDGPDVEALEAYWASLPEDTPGYEACLGAYDNNPLSQLADASADRIPRLDQRVRALRTEWDDNVIATTGPLFDSMGAWDWRDRLAELRAPLLIVHGDEDTVIPEAIAANAEIVRDAQVAVIENAGQMGLVEHPARYVALLDDFLTTLP